MKILDTNSFIEKLNINQIKLNDLENINTIDIDKFTNNAVDYLKSYFSLEFLNKFDSIRFLKSGNIELISKIAKRKQYTGIRCVLYLHSNPLCWRLWHPITYDINVCNEWDYHPSKMGEFNSIEDMMNHFYNWANKVVNF